MTSPQSMPASQSMPSIKIIVIALILLMYAALGYRFKPTERLSEQRGIPVLEAEIPKSFNGWVIDPQTSVLTVSQEVAETLSTIYNNTLSRTYINAKGERMMLSIAYGADQSRTMQVHRPEVCYTSQGFNVLHLQKVSLTYGNRQLPAMHVLARQGERIEPITYWVAIGDYLVRGNVEQGVARLKYASKGIIPDGTLIRVSTLTPTTDTRQAYVLEEQFIRDFLNAVPRKLQARFIGG